MDDKGPSKEKPDSGNGEPNSATRKLEKSATKTATKRKKTDDKPPKVVNNANTSKNTEDSSTSLRAEVKKLSDIVVNQQQQQEKMNTMFMSVVSMMNYNDGAGGEFENEPGPSSASSNVMDMPMAEESSSSGLARFRKSDHDISDDEVVVGAANAQAGPQAIQQQQGQGQDPQIQPQALPVPQVHVGAQPPANDMPLQQNNGDNSAQLGFAQRFVVQEETGPPIADHIASDLQYLMVSPLDDKAKGEAFDRHLRPSNCKTLLVPKVNPVIWSNISQATRSRDLKIQKAQKPLVKGLAAMAKQNAPTNKMVWLCLHILILSLTICARN